MKLLINEFIKDYKKITTWLYVIVIFAVLLLEEYISSIGEGSDNVSGSTLLGTITNTSIGFAMIFSLIMLANNLSQEYSKGTVKFLYTKPKSRSAILTAKIVLGFINYIILLTLGTVFTYIIRNFIFYKGKLSFSALNEKMGEGYFGRTVLQHLMILNLSTLAVMIFYVAMVVLVCVVFKTQILSLVLVMVSVLGGSIITGLTTLIVTKYEWVKYHPFNVELFSNYYASEQGREAIKLMYKFDNANALIIMLVVYSAIFFVVSYIINARRDITID